MPSPTLPTSPLALLSVAVTAALSLPAAAEPAPCAAPRWLVERYVSADCAACWGLAPPTPAREAAGPAVTLDWIVPGTQGDAAPLSAAALPEATARVARAGRLLPDEALTQTSPLPARSGLQVEAQDGIAWNGYVGLRLQVTHDGRAPLATGLQGWVGLVERVAAGEDGSPVPRQLLRRLVGPLSLDELATGAQVDHLRAVRLPDTARPERLGAVGWVETADGRVLAYGSNDPAACAAPPDAAR